MPDPLRLHIGGRERREGWTVFNIEPGPHVDHVGDCRNLSQFTDGSVAEIYASHVFEHLGYFDELPQVLTECFRILSDDGCLRISVPNLEILCRLFLRPELGAEQRFHIMRMMFGGQMDANDFHKVGLTFEFLDDFLRTAGFTSVQKIDTFDLFDDDSSLQIGGNFISLNVTAAK
jgi:predicted SAM-dependent methyltransferase